MNESMDQLEAKAMNINLGDVITISFPHPLKPEQRAAVTEWAEARFPDNKVIALDAGASIGILGNDERMQRIEAKLDMLIDALAEDEPEQEQQFDLDGNEIEQGEDNGGAL